jgi:hypothetical protein
VSVLFSALLTVLSIIETASGGWGLGGRMFSPVYFTSNDFALRFVIDLLPMLLCIFVGSAVASVFVRWKTTGIVVFFAILALIVLASVAFLTLGQHWAAFGDWLGAQGALGLGTWGLIPTVIAAVAGYFILRRATPKN